MNNIDRLDVEIIGKLTADARIGIAELAADLGVSRNTVLQRIKRLEDAEILLGFQPIINLSAVGMPVQAVMSLELDQRQLRQVVKGLAAIPEVVEVKVQAGREDLVVHVAIASLEDLQLLTSRIVDIDGVRKTTSTFSVATPVHYRVQPLLELLTRDAGWGRSTPSPTDPQKP